MKPLYSIFAAVILLGTALPIADAAAEVSVDFFYNNLDSYGDWRQVGDYGYCWQPRDVGSDWRPYSDGRWVYTDAGWTWDSEEPYSWAVYHYGRWARLDRVGWVWVPGTEWGPAWVSWRSGGRYVGWAPLPPDAEFRRSVGFNSRVDVDYDIGPTNYNFVEVRNFGTSMLRPVILDWRQNINIITETTNITRTRYVNDVVFVDGPRYDDISRESAQPIPRLKLDRRQQFDGDSRSVPAAQLRTRVEGDSLHVMAVPFNATPATAPRKAAAKVEKAEVDRGWNNAGPPAEVAKLRSRIKSQPVTAGEQPGQTAVQTTADAPPVAPAASPTPGGKPGKGKPTHDGQSQIPGATVVTDAPSATPAKPGKSAKGMKPVRPDETAPQGTIPAHSEETTPRRPGEAVPQAQLPEGKPHTGDAPTRSLPPAETLAPRKKADAQREETQRKPEQPAARSLERAVPKDPEARSQAGKPEPAPQDSHTASSPQPAKAKAKGNEKKDNKKDERKPPGAPQ